MQNVISLMHCYVANACRESVWKINEQLLSFSHLLLISEDFGVSPDCETRN